MIIPAAIRECVAFVACEYPGGATLLFGTCFFVQKKIAETQITGVAVTARHVVKKIAEKHGAVVIRVNARDDGPTKAIRTPPEDWIYHPSDSSVDVAVFPLNLGSLRPKLAHRHFPVEAILTEKPLPSTRSAQATTSSLLGCFRSTLGPSVLEVLPLCRKNGFQLE